MDPDTEINSATPSTAAVEEPAPPAPVVQDPTVITLPHRIPRSSVSPDADRSGDHQPFSSPGKEKDKSPEIPQQQSSPSEQSTTAQRVEEDSPAPVLPTDTASGDADAAAAAPVDPPADPGEATVSFSEPPEQNAPPPAAAAAAASSSSHSKSNSNPGLKQELAKLGCTVYAGALGSLRLPATLPTPDPGDKVETPRTVHSLSDLLHVTDWEAVVPVVRHRDTIRAYLHMLSKSKDTQKRERSAKQSAVNTVMSSLNDLDYLCDEKVGLERRQAKLQHPQQPLPRGVRRNSSTNLFGAGGDDMAEQASAVKHKIERVVEELDAAKAKLQSAMGDLPSREKQSSAAAREERLASRPRPWASSRPASAASTSVRHTPRKPRDGHDDDDEETMDQKGDEAGMPRKAFIFRPEEIHPRFGSFSKAGATLAKEREVKQFAAKQEALKQKAAIDELRQQVLFNPPMPPRTPPPSAATPDGSADAASAAAPQTQTVDASTPPPSRPMSAMGTAAAPFPYARVSVFKADFEHAARAPTISSASLNCKAPAGSPRLHRDAPKPCRTSPERQPQNNGGIVGVAFGTGGGPPIPPHAAPSNSGSDGLAGATPLRHRGGGATVGGGGGISTPAGSQYKGSMRHSAADPNVEMLVDLVRGRDAELRRLRARAASANPFYKKWGAAARATTHGKTKVGKQQQAAAATVPPPPPPPPPSNFPAAQPQSFSATTPTRRAPSPAFWGVTSASDETLAANGHFVLHGHRPTSATGARK